MSPDVMRARASGATRTALLLRVASAGQGVPSRQSATEGRLSHRREGDDLGQRPHRDAASSGRWRKRRPGGRASGTKKPVWMNHPRGVRAWPATARFRGPHPPPPTVRRDRTICGGMAEMIRPPEAAGTSSCFACGNNGLGVLRLRPPSASFPRRRESLFAREHGALARRRFPLSRE